MSKVSKKITPRLKKLGLKKNLLQLASSPRKKLKGLLKRPRKLENKL